MSQVLMEDNVCYGDAALLAANDLAMDFDEEYNGYFINRIKRDAIIMDSGFAFTPINLMGAPRCHNY